MTKSDMANIAKTLTRDEIIEMATICLYYYVKDTNTTDFRIAPNIEIDGILVKSKLSYGYKTANYRR